eukprot:1159338-Pelagomonas_calceolata.AAC.21
MCGDLVCRKHMTRVTADTGDEEEDDQGACGHTQAHLPRVPLLPVCQAPCPSAACLPGPMFLCCLSARPRVLLLPVCQAPRSSAACLPGPMFLLPVCQALCSSAACLPGPVFLCCLSVRLRVSLLPVCQQHALMLRLLMHFILGGAAVETYEEGHSREDEGEEEDEEEAEQAKVLNALEVVRQVGISRAGQGPVFAGGGAAGGQSQRCLNA